MKNIPWSDEDIKYLIDNYADFTNQELSKKLNRSVESIYKKGKRLKLKKGEKILKQRSEETSKRNKERGRDLSYDLLVDIASKYKTRNQFKHNDPSAYNAAVEKGWLNDICTHMIKASYSIPQIMLGEIMKNLFGKENVLTNDRKILKPLELDVYIPKHKLAFEYDGKRWHLNNKNDELKNNKCKEHNIKLIRIVENNRRYEQDVKNQLIKNLNIINKHCDTQFTKDDIINSNVKGGYENILDEKDIKKLISKYDDYSKFREENPKTYGKLARLKRIGEFTSGFEKHKRKNRT